MKQELLSKVYQHPLIQPDELNRIIAVHRKAEFKKGAVILEQGKISNSYMIMESGLIRSFAYDYKGNDITTDFFCDREVVIEGLSLFQRTPSRETVQAVTDCVCWEIDFEIFQELFHSIDGFPEWGRLWMTGRMFHFKQRIVEMVTISAKERYLQLIREKPQVIRQSPLKYIASYLGITDTSFSRIRKEISS